MKPTFGRFIGVEVTSRPIDDLNDLKEYFSLPKTLILEKEFKVPEVNLQLVTRASTFKLDLRLEILPQKFVFYFSSDIFSHNTTVTNYALID